MGSLAVLIPELQQDPTPAAKLLTDLLRGGGLPPFGEILTIEPETDLLNGLRSQHQTLNILVLSLLARIESKGDVWLIAGKPDVVYALIELWLTTMHTSVVEQSGQIINEMLRIDGATKESLHSSLEDPTSLSLISTPSSGLIWRRIFKDKDVYGLLFRTCDLSQHEATGLIKTQVTTAQRRLLELLFNILYAAQIWESQAARCGAEVSITRKWRPAGIYHTKDGGL